MKHIVCIVCPKGCSLSVDENNGYAVAGAACERGKKYGTAEARCPVRVVASTVKIRGAALPRCPVKTNGQIPKRLVGEAMALLDRLELAAPVCCGAVVAQDVLGTGIDFVATRSMKKEEKAKCNN